MTCPSFSENSFLVSDQRNSKNLYLSKTLKNCAFVEDCMLCGTSAGGSMRTRGSLDLIAITASPCIRNRSPGFNCCVDADARGVDR